MPRKSYDVRILHAKAFASFRMAITAFNSPTDEGRITAVLLGLQHSFEMLLKAALAANKHRGLFDKRNNRSISMNKAVELCQQQDGVRLTADEAGTIRSLDALRDAEQHWHVTVDEGLLYHHARAAVTLFDDLLFRIFGERLADLIPVRVLPISAEPPLSLDLLVDREYERIAELLRPGRKATAEGKARIRSLLAAEAFSDPDSAEVSEADVRRVERGIRDGKVRDQVFPKLTGISSDISGGGITVEVRTVRKGGLPVRFSTDAAVEPAAIRMVDLEKKFYMGAKTMADRVGLSQPKARALREHLGIDKDDDHFSHLFAFESQKLRRYSDNALRVMESAIKSLDVERIWSAHRPVPWNRTDNRPPCDQEGCMRTDAQ